ncbi:hypothetical protein [Treponema porcinum]|uniref:Glycogen recognition site of AMP-activated protein kinase n=1 Tax=Treponema porcinum TaxID=261392 RepID=A0A1T4NAN4_TREPO|nr:hypothetical protein [Treponema porcinum]SJZ76284.1 Glycogen recognition site of AMP-activated protein kinase [Treponema porcinum]
MKKLFAFISLFLLLGIGSAFADVTVKKLADGNVEVTFFYGNPRATEVLLAGDFNNWQNGAEAMTKTDKGFTITKTFKATDELRYKFISDGNWTTDLKAPDFVDDGFGGKNSHVVIADMIGGDDDAGTAKAKINFISWSMFGVQANYKTQGAVDKKEKGLDLDSVTIGAKSYNKFAGNFLPNCPVYIEIALAETEMEDYAGNTSEKLNYLYRKDAYDNETVEWSDGLKNLVNGIFGNPIAYLAGTTNNQDNAGSWGSLPGPGSNPFLGHLKFGFNTPYINFLTGFNYAKPDVRQAITWKTIDGNWDAGYQHVGGFNVFSLGSKSVAALEEATGLTFDIGFAPNRTADRKGTKYGYWGWAGVKKDDLVIDFQTNGMYGNDYLFYDPVEHDFILGAKDTFAAGDGKLNVAVQGLIATHQKSSQDIKDDGASNTTDYFGYSTDVFYRSGDFDGIKNIAANVQVGYKADLFGANVEYRFRGAQASMLYLRENHDDGTFDLSETLGNVNTQRIAFNGFVNPIEALSINLGVEAEMALEKIDCDDDYSIGYLNNVESWYAKRCSDYVDPHLGIDSGAEFTFNPAVSYKITDSMSVSVAATLNYNAFTYTKGWEKYQSEINKKELESDDIAKYGASDSRFRFKKAGLTFNMTPDSDIVKGVNVYYGLDMSNEVRYFNTLVGQVMFPGDVTANLAFGLKTENTASADESFDSDVNNPFAFAVGVSKRFKAMKKPTLYAQFVYNMDPFKHFGDGQDQLNMNGANVNGSWAKETENGSIDPVDWYDGRAALRCGIRWDI